MQTRDPNTLNVGKVLRHHIIASRPNARSNPRAEGLELVTPGFLVFGAKFCSEMFPPISKPGLLLNQTKSFSNSIFFRYSDRTDLSLLKLPKRIHPRL